MIVNMLFNLSLAKVLENESYIELKENPFLSILDTLPAIF